MLSAICGYTLRLEGEREEMANGTIKDRLQ